MEINKNSFLARYYMFMFDSLPDNFCILFWNTLISIILLPFTLMYRTVSGQYDWDMNPLILKTIYGIGIWIAFLLLGILGAGIIQKIGWIDFLKMSIFLIIPLGFVAACIFFAICIGIMVGMFYSIEKGWKKLKENKNYDPYKEEVPSKFSVIWNTIRNKYCTKINWK